jgi:hypothetical protein
MSAHSILPPSGAKAWRQCAMWVTMNQMFPQPDTPESLEGTAAHWVFEEMLAGQPVCEGQVAPNGTVVTEEMIEGGELVAQVVAERLPADRFTLGVHIEKRVAIPFIHDQCFGTPDIWAFDPTNMVLEVIDYKFGHRFVDEFENDQGVAYISGILDALAAWLKRGVGLVDQHVMVNFTVIQPRCFYKGNSVRTWSFKASDIRGHINLLKAAAERALAPNPTATTNSECIHCPGRHSCEALQKAAYSDAEFAVQSTPVQLSPTAASLELKMLERSLERLNSRVEGLRETVTAYAKQGQVVPWHKIEQTCGRQVWNVKPEEIVALGAMLEKDLSKVAVVTPKQALKIGIDEAVISAYSATPMGSLKLVPNNPADARRVFGKI